MIIPLDVPEATPAARSEIAGIDRAELGTAEAEPIQQIEGFLAGEIEDRRVGQTGGHEAETSEGRTGERHEENPTRARAANDWSRWTPVGP